MDKERLAEIQDLANKIRHDSYTYSPLVDLNMICMSHNILVFSNHDMFDVECRLGRNVHGMLLRDLDNPELLKDVPDAVIFLNRNDSESKKRFSTAVELGHFFLHTTEKLRISYHGDYNDEIAEASHFACELLMPEDLVRSEYKKYPLLVPREFARIFNVSSMVVEIRLDQLGLKYMTHLV